MFYWKDDFSVKIPLIDEQHKRLFNIGNSINELLKEYNGQDTFDEIMNQLDELSNYTKYHFAQEEKLMSHYGFEGLDEHIKEHRDFIAYLDGLDYNNIDEDQEETLMNLIKFVTSWIFKHIMNTDFKYCDFIVKKINIVN